MSISTSSAPHSVPSNATNPGAVFKVRQTPDSEDWTPDPSRSIPLPSKCRALINEIIDLYSCKPTGASIVKQYKSDCVYDDQFAYADNHHKMASQWFALPKLFKESKSKRYETLKNEKSLIQFKNKQTWTFAGIHNLTTINALVSLSLNPAASSRSSQFVQVKYHKDQANQKDYSHKGPSFLLKKWQADHVSDWMNDERVKAFEADKDAGVKNGNKVHRYESGTAQAPKTDL